MTIKISLYRQDRKNISWVSCFAIVLCALVLAGGALAQSATTGSVHIPNYWDSHRRIEKPNLAGLTGPLRFLTAPDHPPFNFLNSQGELAGFHVELLRAACLELELSCTLQARAFDTLLPALIEKRVDAVVAGLALTPALRMSAEVGDIYLQNPARFVVRSDAPPFGVDGEALRGKRLGALANSAHAAFLEAFYKSSQLRTFTTALEARLALKSGEIDALFADAVGLSFWINGTASENCCTFRGGAFSESYFFGEGYAFAFRQGAVPLRQAFDYALRRLAERGIFSELYLRWFPIGLY